MSNTLPFQTAKQLASAIRKKKIGCLELLDLYLERIAAHNPELNAIIAMDVEGARKQAKAADRAVKAGKKLGPLHGVPMTLKESYDIAGYPDDLGQSGVQGPEDREELARRPAPGRCRRDPVRQDQRAAEPGRLAELQRGLRPHQESVGPVAHAGRLVRRLGRGAGRRPDRPRGGQRHRRLDPQSRALLRRVRPQADLRRGLAARPCARRQRRAGRHQRVRSARPRRRGSRDRHGRDGRTGRDRRPRLDAHPAALEEEDAARVQGRGRALRPQLRGRPVGAGRAAEARHLPRQAEGQGERHGAAGDRHGRAERRLCPPAARGDLGPHDRRGLEPGGARRRRPARFGHELLRPDAARQLAVASHLAGAQREAPPHAARLGRVLQGLRPAALPGRGDGGLPARSQGPAPRAHHRREQQAGAGGRPDLLGRLLVRHLPARLRRADRPDAATACRSACRSSARNMATTTASSSPSCWRRNTAASCRRPPISKLAYQ